MSSKICSFCGKENPESSIICENCGSLILNVPGSDKKSFSLKEGFERVFREYLPQRKRIGTTAAPIAHFIKNELIDTYIYLIEEEGIPYTGYYASVGVGNLAHCPQLSIGSGLGANIGLHYLFVFKADMSGVYLSMRYSGRLDPDDSLKTKRDVYQYCIRKHFPKLEFLDSIDLKSDTAYSRSYVKSTIISKFYSKDDIPSDEALISDLKEFIECGDLLYELKPLKNKELVEEIQNKTI